MFCVCVYVMCLFVCIYACGVIHPVYRLTDTVKIQKSFVPRGILLLSFVAHLSTIPINLTSDFTQRCYIFYIHNKHNITKIKDMAVPVRCRS